MEETTEQVNEISSSSDFIQPPFSYVTHPQTSSSSDNSRRCTSTVLHLHHGQTQLTLNRVNTFEKSLRLYHYISYETRNQEDESQRQRVLEYVLNTENVNHQNTNQ